MRRTAHRPADPPVLLLCMIHATSDCAAHGKIRVVKTNPSASSRRRKRCTGTRLALTMTTVAAVHDAAIGKPDAVVVTFMPLTAGGDGDVRDGVVADTVVDGVVADTVADGAVADTVVDGVVADTVVDGVVADTVVDGVMVLGAESSDATPAAEHTVVAGSAECNEVVGAAEAGGALQGDGSAHAGTTTDRSS